MKGLNCIELSGDSSYERVRYPLDPVSGLHVWLRGGGEELGLGVRTLASSLGRHPGDVYTYFVWQL